MIMGDTLTSSENTGIGSPGLRRSKVIDSLEAGFEGLVRAQKSRQAHIASFALRAHIRHGES
jgi:hypothetical protein